MQIVTAGESHGPQLTAIISGFPAGLAVDVAAINTQLAERQAGYGRGARQQIEHDTVQFVGGLRHGITLGSPIALVITNRDHNHWTDIMSPTAPATPANTVRQLTAPRPGHADLAGGMKYDQRDLRNVLERASARETAIQVAIGALCSQLLAALGITLTGYVTQVGPISLPAAGEDVATINQRLTGNDLRITDQTAVATIHAQIDAAKITGTTLGGLTRVVVNGLPAGLGSCMTYASKLDARIAAAVMGVNAVKGVMFGSGLDFASQPGHDVMDAITYTPTTGYSRTSNHLGGFEGGMTNGMPVTLTAIVKPIPTQYHPLPTVDIRTHTPVHASVERSDVTAIVPASLIIAQVVATTLTEQLLAEFTSNNLTDLLATVAAYRTRLHNY